MTNTVSDTADTTSIVRLHLVRAIASIAWAVLLVIAGIADDTAVSVSLLASALLVIYPIIDVVASAVEIRMGHHRARTNDVPLLVNTAISVVAAVAVALAAGHGAGPVLYVFGIWALLTGLVQLGMSVVRRRRGTPAQWPMILSGGISALAGSTFVRMATRDDPKLTVLAGYAVAGAVFLLVSVYRLRVSSNA